MSSMLEFRDVADKLYGIKADVDRLDFGNVKEFDGAKKHILRDIQSAYTGLSLMFTIASICEITGSDMEEEAIKFFAEEKYE